MAVTPSCHPELSPPARALLSRDALPALLEVMLAEFSSSSSLGGISAPPQLQPDRGGPLVALEWWYWNGGPLVALEWWQ